MRELLLGSPTYGNGRTAVAHLSRAQRHRLLLCSHRNACQNHSTFPTPSRLTKNQDPSPTYLLRIRRPAGRRGRILPCSIVHRPVGRSRSSIIILRPGSPLQQLPIESSDLHHPSCPARPAASLSSSHG